MALRVFNTLSRKKEDFVPASPEVVRIYTCGLTVYSRMHIGHARTYCFWDMFRRYLEYNGYHVMSVINYTDIDDRLMDRATDTVGSIDIAERVIASFRNDCRMLKIKDYAVYTRATDFIRGQIEMVAQLIGKGHAYVVNGEVFYDVASFPGYGKLSGRTVEEQQVGASGRVGEDVSRKRNPADFTLWKPSEGGQPSWQTGHPDWPQGRPGWHIECSVMSSETLGATFDLHGGAVDNMFPHHENEIAQSEPLCGCSTWVKYWMHPEHLDLRGEKMSKSLGNVVGVPDLLERHSYDKVRWFYAMNHYRTKLAFSGELIDSAAEGYRKITNLLDILEGRLSKWDEVADGVPARGEYASLREPQMRVPRLRHYYEYGQFAELATKFIAKFREAMDDDVNSPQATAAMFEYVNELYKGGIESSDDMPSVLAAYRCLARHLYVLGIERPNELLYPQLAMDCFPVGGSADTAAQDAFIDRLVEARGQARADKDWAKADMLRDLFAQCGLEVEDTAEGARWKLKG
ncbi:MAG: cysteine--tRNA ligase [Planctomycetales bacterium]|nr:cysteine--tRNA ligase [bacterium]UNM08452.1 MAG: cysteine--tRNA ligase [Planctomycetales bacterium]